MTIGETAPNDPLLERAERPNYTAEIREGEAEGLIASLQLFPPGRIALIKPLTHSKFQAKWVDCGELDHVVLSSRMIDDHKPYNVGRALRAIAGQPIDL